ncbi:MAG: hypothetical protein JNK82_33995, partial [Myxococcaceae bacterium]|nr:hypothetical protein [Myxococcaceae bacterium]
MRTVIVVVALTSAACLTPRSMMLGQMAGPIGKGAAEIGVATGIGYSQQATTVPGTTNNTTGARVWTIPAVEGNAHFGLNDHVGINAHFSPAGVQPGLKITVNKSRRAHFAIMPQLAMGYVHVRSAAYATGNTGSTNESDATSTSMFTFMAGLRLMVSHVSGFYCGVGGDFIATRAISTPTVNNALPSTINNTLQLAIAANVGFSISLGWVRIRPEIAFAVQPWLQSGRNFEDTALSGSGGFGWALLPGFSLVAATPTNTRDEGAEDDERKVGPTDDRDERDRRDRPEDREDRDEREE